MRIVHDNEDAATKGLGRLRRMSNTKYRLVKVTTEVIDDGSKSGESEGK